MRNSFQTGNDTGRRYLSAVIEKGNGTAEKLTFTNNQAAFTLKKDESVDISCLRQDGHIPLRSQHRETNFEVSYSIKWWIEKPLEKQHHLQWQQTGTEDIQFTNTSTVTPPVTGRNIQNNSWIMMLIVVLLDWHWKQGIFQKSKKKNIIKAKRKNCACEVKNLKV